MKKFLITLGLCWLSTLAFADNTNPYGLSALWQAGDSVARATLIFLAIMSLITWRIIFYKTFQHIYLVKQTKAMQKDFWQAPSFSEAINTLANDSAYRYIAASAWQANQQYSSTLQQKLSITDWNAFAIQRAVTHIKNDLNKGLAFLATIGSTAPFIGLFGTVWGIYHALTAIGVAGQASIDKVAGPVGEALIMTALGLAVAVPAVLAYNALTRRNKVVLEHISEFSDEVHAALLRETMPQDAP